MDELLQKINARLQHYNRDELLALIWDFLEGFAHPGNAPCQIVE
jgi:hypothetical protein